MCAVALTSTMALSGAPAAAADPIPDTGLPAQPVAASPVVSERTEILAAGVVGENSNNDSFPNTNIRVAAIAEYDGMIFVGGKFTQVEIASTRQRFDQPFLAAFDRETGAWIDTFRPTLDGNVWDLKVTDDGRLIVAGQFTNVNGEANTRGVAAIDPVSGAVVANWRVNLTLTGSTQRPIARALDIEGDFLYIGGNFTRITGTNGDTKNTGRIARVNLATGNADGAFLPNVDGIVFDVDATPDRVYVVGNFFYANGVWSIGMAPFSPNNGQLITGLQPWVRTYTQNVFNSYQQAILSLGDEVWQTGSQHNTQAYRTSDYQLLRSYVTHPWGDGQALAELNGVVYQGSHANGDTYSYADTIFFPALTGWTSRLPTRWMAAFDGTIGASHDQYDWYPQIGTQRGEGSWELFADSVDCLWTGGDFNRGSFDGNVARYVGGFARFCATDTTPPEPPTNPTAELVGDGVNLAWTGSVDDRGGQVRYEILKNDSVFASFISIQTFRDPNGTADDRYFVRAMDSTGNRSATTQVFRADDGPDTTRPTTPGDLAADIEANGDVTLTWTASTDNLGVVGYRVLRNGAQIDEVVDITATIPTPAAGDHWYQVLAFDAAGNQSFRTPPVQVTIDAGDTTAPTTPQDLAADIEANGDVTLIWTASSDDVGVVEYDVYRNNVVIATVPGPTTTITAPAVGDHWYQVRARDAAANESFKTPPLRVTIAPDPAVDTSAPTTPQNLAATLDGNGDAVLTWTASSDDVGVVDYLVFRNGVVIDTVTEATATIPTPAAGSHWYQVRARDAAGNESFKTPPIEFVVEGADSTPPTTPQNLAGVVEANGDVTLTWGPSADDVGVVDYVVYRNNVEIVLVTDPTAVIPAPAAGSHWYQVRARDAAGNQSFKTPPLRIDI